MKELFGLAMSDLLIGVVVLLIIVGVVVASLAWRHPLLFKLGIRNLPRRRAQTVLIVLGLTISTLIISAAFTTGDTFSSSLRNIAFEITGPIDHTIDYDAQAGSTVSQRDAVVPEQVAAELKAEFADDPDIAGFVRVIFDVVAAENVDTKQAEPMLFLLGLDPAEVDATGGIPALEGGGNIRLSELGAGKIIVNESAVEQLAAQVGNRIQLRVLGREHEFEVSALAEDTLLSGKVNLAEPQGVVIHLRDAQAIFDQPERLSGIGVTVRGGIEGALERSAAVDAKLNRFLEQRAGEEVLEGVPEEERIYADRFGRPLFVSDPFKADTVNDAEDFGSIFTSFFLVMGTFSIAAGILLIFLIFVMLAEERKTEMGISRAVGMQRGQLVQAFLAEGLAYNLGAAVVGTAIGIFVAFSMVEVLDIAFRDFGLRFTQHVEPRSVVVAAGIGILLTFVTVVASAFRASQLNIVSAIRDIPESSIQRRRRISLAGLISTPLGLLLLPTSLLSAPIGALILSLPRIGAAITRRGRGGWVVLPAWSLMRWRQEWWFVFVLLGAILVLNGVDAESAFLYLAGLSLAPMGLLLLARRLYRAGRLPHSAMGALILFFWLIPRDWHIAVVGKELEGDIEMFVLSGVMMVTAATVLVIVNLDILVRPLQGVGRLFGRLAPAVKMAMAYPSTARYRTGMTVAMIAIIMFALVTFTTINANFSRAFTSDAAAGGFDVQADATLNDAIDDLGAALEEAGEAAVLAKLEGVSRLRVGSTRGTDIQTLAAQRWDSPAGRPILTTEGESIFDRPETGSEQAQLQTVFFAGADRAFLLENRVPLQARAVGFDSDEAVWEALARAEERYAVVTALALGGDGGFGGLDDDSFELPDTVNERVTRIPQVRVLLENGGQLVVLTIIGVVDQAVSVTAPAFPEITTLISHEDHLQLLYEEPDLSRHLARVAAGADPRTTAQAIEAALRVETVSIIDALKDQQDTFNAILALFQGFTGLGLLAGMAALGVIAVRSVVERRQQIGMLRAVGFRGSLVQAQLLLEMSFIAALGIILGAVLAVALAWRLFEENAFGTLADMGFYVPIGQIAIFAVIALVASLIMTYLPARQASRITIAEALRYE